MEADRVAVEEEDVERVAAEPEERVVLWEEVERVDEVPEVLRVWAEAPGAVTRATVIARAAAVVRIFFIVSSHYR